MNFHPEVLGAKQKNHFGILALLQNTWVFICVGGQPWPSILDIAILLTWTGSLKNR